MGKELSKGDHLFEVLNPSGLMRESVPVPLADRGPALTAEEIRIVVVGGETNPYTQIWQMSRPSSVIINKWL